MKKVGIALILISIALCLASIVFIPARLYEFDPGDIIRMMFLTGTYLLTAIIGALLLILDNLKKNNK